MHLLGALQGIAALCFLTSSKFSNFIELDYFDVWCSFKYFCWKSCVLTCIICIILYSAYF